ncbi:MAG: hypothetical protein HKO89_01720 [Saprospiraceae bacterium]|nr:hypothetical protein [Bacteroidia bacterium]NNK89301.1 hypothetical protein [Saprospiraceae bacterium]
MKRLLILFLFALTSLTTMHAQTGIGLTISNDLYNRYVNPKDGIESPSNGSVLLNLAIGPKIWLGSESFSFSAEAQANWGILALSLADYKGLGSASFPIMGKFNFAGLSGLNKEGRFGFSIGGGIQFNKTEIYYQTNDFKEKGGERSFFKTYVIQAGYGFGISGFTMHGFVKYGFDPDVDGASNLHIGIQYDFNIPKLSKISDPASAL